MRTRVRAVCIAAVVVAAPTAGASQSAIPGADMHTYGNWTVIVRADPMTDKRMTIGMAVGKGGTIALRCMEPGPNSVEVVFLADTFLGAVPDNVVRPLTYRFDEDTAVGLDWAYDDKSARLPALRGGAAFVERLQSANRLLVRANTYDYTPVDASFEVAGAAEAVKKVLEECA